MQRFFLCLRNSILFRFIVFILCVLSIQNVFGISQNINKSGFGLKFADADLFMTYPFLVRPPSFAIAVEGQTKFVFTNKQLRFASVYTLRKHSFGADYRYEGGIVLNKQRLGFVYLHRFSDALAVSLRTAYCLQNKIENRRGDLSLDLEIGLSYSLTANLTTYARFSNPIYLRQQEKKKKNKAYFLEVGALYKLGKSLSFSLAFSKDPMYPLYVECGMGYQVGKSVLLSASTALQPFQNKVGFSYCFASFTMGFELLYQSPLGYSSLFSFAWYLTKRDDIVKSKRYKIEACL